MPENNANDALRASAHPIERCASYGLIGIPEPMDNDVDSDPLPRDLPREVGREIGRPNGRGRQDCVIKCHPVEIVGAGKGKGNSGRCPEWIYGWGLGNTADQAWNAAWDAADINSPRGCQKRHCQGIAGSCKGRKGGKAKSGKRAMSGMPGACGNNTGQNS